MSLLDRLEEAAKKATPGPWHWRERDWSKGHYDLYAGDVEVLGAMWVHSPDEGIVCAGDADVVYIAAASPDTILALVAVARAAEQHAQLDNDMDPCAGSPCSMDAALSALAALDERVADQREGGQGK